MGVGIGAYSGVFMFVFVFFFLKHTKELHIIYVNDRNLVQRHAELPVSTAYITNPCPRNAGPSDGQGSSCSPASCMICCTEGLCPWKTDFPEKTARSLPQDLLEERIWTIFRKKRYQRCSGLCDLKRMFWTLPIALLPATFHVVRASLATSFFPRENELTSLRKMRLSN